MKNILIASNILFAGIALILSCGGANKIKASASASTAVSKCYDCTRDTFYGLTARDFMLDIARYRDNTLKLINNHLQTRSFITSGLDATNALPVGNSRACWYPLDSVKKFICLIEEYAGRIPGIRMDSLGIRFYFASYPANTAVHNELIRPGYEWHNTLILVPTYNFYDFDPRYSTAPISDKLDSVHFNTRLMALEFGTRTGTFDGSIGMDLNQSHLCPPNCPLSYNSLKRIDYRIPPSIDY